MIKLYDFLIEGGASGHMKHPYNYTELTLRDIKGLIRDLFSGKIEDITEKIDGTNIQATMNTEGTVVFIRNKSDLNSKLGGMTIEDMAAKWADKPSISKTFLTAGSIITQVFNKIGKSFFNPSENKKLVLNCECVIEGKTNVLYYNDSQVDFHDIWIYEKGEDDKWEHTDTTKKGLDVINKACENLSSAKITPNIIIKTQKDSENMLVSFIKKIDKIFKEAGCKENSTIEEYKLNRFRQIAKEKDLEWLYEDPDMFNTLFKRWFNADKSVNIRIIKNSFTDHLEEFSDIEKTEYKKIVQESMFPIDNFFIELGNSIIELCDGILNADNKTEVVKQLKTDLQDAVAYIRTEGSDDANQRLTYQLERLEGMGLNASEGIVFRYKGKLMKCTGSFAALNAAIGLAYKK